jgi:hypothetical protein
VCAVRRRTCFGSRGSGVRISPPRPLSLGMLGPRWLNTQYMRICGVFMVLADQIAKDGPPLFGHFRQKPQSPAVAFVVWRLTDQYSSTPFAMRRVNSMPRDSSGSRGSSLSEVASPSTIESRQSMAHRASYRFPNCRRVPRMGA